MAARTKKAVAKERRLQAVRDILVKKLGSGSVHFMSDGSRSLVRAVVPSGIHVLDNYVIGCGGFPVGRITELFSEEGGGKTTLGLTVIGHTQQAGGAAVLFENEHSLDEERARLFGVDMDNLLLVEVEYLEKAVDAIPRALAALPDGLPPSVLVWDSIAATPTKKEFDSGINDPDGPGDRARILGILARGAVPVAARKNVALVFINQMRDKIGMSFGNAAHTPGGKAMKFHASLRLQIMGGKAFKGAVGQHLGKDITVIAIKNKMAPPWRKARLRLVYTDGWDNDWSMLRHAKDFKVVGKQAKASADTLRVVREHFALEGWDKVGGVAEKYEPGDELDEDEED